MTPDSEELGRLIAALPPAPEAWVRAAQMLPRARRELDGLMERAAADERLRARLVADLEQALATEGIEPSPVALAEARARLRSLEP